MRCSTPYGSFGAIPRRLQMSAWFLNNELNQLQTAGIIVPAIFLGVAAFLLNVSLNRIVAVQREQIAALKAVGYSNGELARHYMGWSLIISLAGAVARRRARQVARHRHGRALQRLLQVPVARARSGAGLHRAGAARSASAAGVVGALAAVRHVVSLAPAEAMRPPAPEQFRQTLVERLGLKRRLSPAVRMILQKHCQPADPDVARDLRHEPGRGDSHRRPVLHRRDRRTCCTRSSR